MWGQPRDGAAGGEIVFRVDRENGQAYVGSLSGSPMKRVEGRSEKWAIPLGRSIDMP